jgi:dolichyl-phosphate-mannose-protein mannosyltransferase
VLYAWVWFVPRPARPPNSADLGYVTEIWSRADSGWFLSIAQHGYQRNGGAVFYPLYPLLIGGLGRAFGGNYVSAGIVVSLACCLGAFYLLYRLAVPRLGVAGARRALLYLAIFPMSLFLQAVYSESLYLLCALSAFVFAERRQWLGAGVMTGLALLTRLAGVALIPPLLILAWRSPERRRALLSMLAAPALAALYPLWLELKLRAIYAAFANEAGWGRHLSPAGPLGGLWHGVAAAWHGVKQIATGDPNMQAGAHNLEYLAFLVLFLWLGVEAWRRFGAPYGLFVLGSLAIPLSAPTVGYPLLSMPRFCLPLFPAFLALAAFADTERRDRTILVLSSVFLGVTAVAWSVGQWVS